AVIANAPHPATFRRLLWTDPGQRRASRYIRTLRDTANDALVREQGLGALLAKALDWERPPQMPPAELAGLMQEWADPQTAFAMLNWYRASPLKVPPADAPYRMPLLRLPTLMPKVRIPTLVVWGMDDEALLPANLDGLDRWATDLTIAKVSGAGHFVPWEAPEAVNAAMDSFLARTA